MSHIRPRLGRHALVLAIAMLLVVPVGAQATTVDYDGDTLVVTAATTPTTTSSSGCRRPDARRHPRHQCVHVDPRGLRRRDANTGSRCPGHGNLKVNLGAGNDDVTFVSQGFDCFNAYELNLGDGANTVNLSDQCGDPTGPTTVNAGAGPDVLTAGSQAFTFNAGGGNDSLYGSPGNDALHGGEGDDRLFGYEGSDQVLGEGGADQTNGGAGNDNVDGGAGDDGLEHCSNCIGSNNDPGVGADTYVGGPGNDKLWLDGHNSGMTISIDGQANDGSSGEGDNVGSDIETIAGTVTTTSSRGPRGPTPSRATAATTRSTARAATTTSTAAAATTASSATPATTRSRARAAPTASTAERGSTRSTATSPRARCSARSTPTRCSRATASATLSTAAAARTARRSTSSTWSPSARTWTARPSRRRRRRSRKGQLRRLEEDREGEPQGPLQLRLQGGAGTKGKAVFRNVAKKSFTTPASGRVTLKMALTRAKLALLRRKGKIKTKLTVTLRDGAGGSSVASKNVTLKR